jgi:sugar O-acyltransferase (sialic acid O-acetyltransferase NeuD family)
MLCVHSKAKGMDIKMKDLIIVGAGSVGRERLSTIKKINKIERKWNIKGFLSDFPDVLDGIECDLPIIDTIVDYIPKENDIFVCGIAKPKDKEKVVTIMKNKGARFETIIHPASIIGDFVTLGEGCFVFGTISPNAKLGNFVSIMGSMVGGAIIGDFSTTTGYANITSAKLGKRVFVGSHAVILNNLIIGDDAYIGAGSVVIKNVKPGTKVFGNPAKKIEF